MAAAHPDLPRSQRLLTAATAAGLFVLGVAYGAWAVWLTPVRLFGGVEGLSLVVTAVGTLVAGLLAAWCFRSWRAGFLPIGGWFVATAGLGMTTGPGGDVLVPGALPYDPGVVKVGEFNWLAGMVAAAIVLVLAARRYGAGPR
jgi:hypothetical protein